MNTSLVLGLIILASLAGLAYACFNFFSVKKLEEGTDRMKTIAGEIRLGANTFIEYEYKVIAIAAVIVAIVIALLISWSASIAFVIGAVMSAVTGFIGMKIATYANVRVTNKARTTKSLSDTLKVAFKGGSVVGICVSGFALLGIFLVFLIFGVGMNQMTTLYDPSKQVLGNSTTSILGLLIKDFPALGDKFSMTISSYSLGCSIVALFARMGGGIYTKAADMGADLVGKTEAHLPEDDPRNPATIADNVGDNVGDVAGLGADLLESYVGAMMSGIIMAIELAGNHLIYNLDLVKALMLFPLALSGIGLIGCILGIASLFIRKKLSDNPHKELNGATYISAGITVLGTLVAAYLLFKDVPNLKDEIGFLASWVSPWIGAALGILSGIIIGKLAEYYTSADYKPTQEIAEASKEGPALTVTQGLAVGMISCMYPCVVLGLAIFISFVVAGPYGVAAAAIGMLSFVAVTVSVDSYGPISDNAGGIAEMSYLEEDVREITDTLDSVGNTTAAIGKGFAIGSAAMAVLCMMTSYMFSFAGEIAEEATIANMFEVVSLNVINPLGLAGAIIGGALPFMFSGMLIKAVAKAAERMVEEVRRQFKEIPGLLEGNALPDTKTCIGIATQGSISEMKAPALVAIAIPVVSGFVFGAEFVGGILVGATLSAIMLAVFTGNAGGAWDNGKKYIEVGGLGKGYEKGNELYDDVHDAGVVGDTVGDPLKDTVGPCLDILIKIMSTLSLVMGAAFYKFNLYSLIKG